MSNPKKQIIFVIFLFLGVVGMFGFVRSQEMLTSSANVSYDSYILETLQNRSEVGVIVTLRVNLVSNYSSSTKDSNEYNLYLGDIKKQVSEIQSQVIPFLSEDEFKIKYVYELSPSFSGNITKKGLEKLINNSMVSRIEYNFPTYLSNSLFCGYITCDNLTYQRYQHILKEFNTTNWTPVIVEMFSAEKTDNLISSFSETDFKNLKKELSPSIFTVEVTKTGLDELFNNSDIKAINLQESLSPVGNNSIESKFNWLWIIIPVVIILIILGIFFIKKKK